MRILGSEFDLKQDVLDRLDKQLREHYSYLEYYSLLQVGSVSHAQYIETGSVCEHLLWKIVGLVRCQNSYKHTQSSHQLVVSTSDQLQQHHLYRVDLLTNRFYLHFNGTRVVLQVESL